MKIKTCAALAGAFCLAMSSAALADVVQMATFGPSSPNFGGSLTFAKYSGVEPLLGVEIILEVNQSGGKLDIDNDGVGFGTVTMELGTDVNLTSTDVILFPPFPTATVSTVGAALVAANDGDSAATVDITGGPDNATLLGGFSSDTQMITYFAPFILASFTGGGTFDIDYDADTFVEVDGLSGVAFAFIPTTVDGKVTVRYITVIPETSTVGAIAALGLLGLVVGRRFRKRA